MVLQAVPGKVYRFADVTLDGVNATGDKAGELTKAFGIKPGDPVDAETERPPGVALRVVPDRLEHGGVHHFVVVANGNVVAVGAE